MSDKGSFRRECDEDLRERVFKDFSSEMQSVLDKLGGTFVSQRFESVVRYNDNRRNHIFPLDIVSIFYELAEDEDKQNLNKIQTAHFLNWCIELLCWAHLIIDDVIDNGQMRYGRICWHQRSDVGLSAINDALLLDKSVTYLMGEKLEKSFLDILHEQMIYLTAGQSLNDLLSKITDLDCIDGALYEKMCIVQNSPLITFPFKLGVQLAGKANQISEEQIKPVLSKIAVVFQMLNDYQDLFGDSKLVGKYGTDIEQRKCTWFEANFLETASPDKIELFNRIYGSKDPANVAEVKDLYNNLQMKDQFNKHKNDICKRIEIDIASVQDSKLRHVLFSMYKKTIDAGIETAHL